MKNTLKTTLAMLLSFAMLLTFAAAEDAADGADLATGGDDAATTTVVYDAHTSDSHLGSFTDAPAADSWMYQPLNCAVANGIMNGSGNTIRPNAPLTRAEMATMMVRVIDAHDIKANISGYTDVISGQWYYDYIASGVAANIINGSGNRMMPNEPITREQAFAILARTFLFSPTSADASASFSDASNVSAWAKYTTNALIDAKVVLGDSRNTIRPKANITRAELATLLDRIVCNYLDASVNYNGATINGSVIYSDPSIDLTGATINGSIYVVDSIGTDAVDLSGVAIQGRIVIRAGNVAVNEAADNQVVRKEDYSENGTPSQPDNTPSQDNNTQTPDDNKGDDSSSDNTQGSTGAGSSSAGSSPNSGSLPGSSSKPSASVVISADDTYISYGTDNALYAEVSGNEIVFDLRDMDADATTVLDSIYVGTGSNFAIALDGFAAVDYATNVEIALVDLLADIEESTSGELAELLGIPTGSDVNYTLVQLADAVDSACAAYTEDASEDGWMKALFEEHGITCAWVDGDVETGYASATFAGTIGGSAYKVTVIVPNFNG